MTTTVTKTVKSAGGDYTSLSAWEAAQQGDLTGVRDEIAQAECYAFNDTTAFTIDGWTTSATQYIRIYAASGQGHAGYWDAAKFYLSATDIATTTGIVTVLEDFVRLEGLQIQITMTGGNDSQACIKVGNLAATSDMRVDTCLLRGVISGATGTAFGLWGADSTDGNAIIKVINTVAFDFYDSSFPNTLVAMGFYNQFSDMRLYNCTAYNCNTGFFVTGTTYKSTAVNCLSYGNAVNANYVDFSTSTRFQNSSNNASTDASAPGTSVLTSQASTDIDFLSTTATNANFLAIDSTSTLVGAGTNDPLAGVYADDIRSEARTSTWDIGADEYVAAGASSPTYPQLERGIRGLNRGVAQGSY